MREKENETEKERHLETPEKTQKTPQDMQTVYIPLLDSEKCSHNYDGPLLV